MQTWLWSGITLPHSGHSRRGSVRSKRYSTAAIVPNTGSTKPIRNQMKNEEPLIFPTMPADRPKKSSRTRKPPPSTGAGLEDADGPDDRDDRDDHDHDPRDGRHHADHELEQDPGGRQEHHEGESLHAEPPRAVADPLGVTFHGT